MPVDTSVEMIGYVWVSSGGAKACEPCRRLHGQEFFLRPQPGQNSVSDMPDPPLHPNCRCTVQPLTRVAVKLPENQPGHKEPYIQGGRKFQGGYWLNNGRSIGDGPVWKKWCGENWGGGRDLRDPLALGPDDPSPADDLDSACKNHDDCYESEIDTTCDRRLVRELEALPDDPRQWKEPPSEEDIKDASDYRKATIWWFKFRIFKQEMKEQGYREDLPITP